MPSNRYRTGYVATEEDGADLTFARQGKKHWTLHYIPSPDAVKLAKQIDAAFTAPKQPILLVEGDSAKDVVTTHPLNTTATSREFLQPKYEVLRTVSFEGFNMMTPTDEEEAGYLLKELPAGFIQTAYFGLGVAYDLRYLTSAVEKTGATDLRIRGGRSKDLPALTNGSYVVSRKMFDDARKAINRTHNKALVIASDEKRTYAHNTLLTALDATAYPLMQVKYRKNAVRDAIGNSPRATLALSADDQEVVVRAARSAVKSLNRTKPTELLELTQEIELVTLETLIDRMQVMLCKKLDEPTWQTFFTANPFVLRLAFGFPIVILDGQVSVGGGKFSGVGGKISDFAAKAAASGNLALIEIKKADVDLMEKTAYRGGVFGPSRELAGAVNQVLDQRYQLQKNIQSLKDNSDVWDVETYAVQCLVVAGRTPTNKDRLKSFELFRNGWKSVMVVTFDELLGKLEHLREFLLLGPSAASKALSLTKRPEVRKLVSEGSQEKLQQERGCFCCRRPIS